MPITAVPQSVQVGALMQTRDDYPGLRANMTWRLYKGGKLFDPRLFIRQRAYEPMEMYHERLARAFYLGYIGEIVDFFVANLFLKEPTFRIGANQDLPEFYSKLSKNSDRAKTDFNAFDRDRWTRALVQGSAFTWVNLPSLPTDSEGNLLTLPETVSVAQLDGLNLRDSYLVPLNAHEMIYWERDELGNFSQVIIHQEWIKRPGFLSAERVKLHRWTIQTVEEFMIYEALEELKWNNDTQQWESKDPDKFWKSYATLMRRGPHPFKQVPIVELSIDSALCIGDKIYDTQRHMVEMDNGISWQQFQSLYAMPVISSEKDFDQTMGESFFIQLRPGETMTYAEPEGKAIQTSMARRQQLQEELFRVSHQMALAIRSEAGTAARSGESKRRDSTATEVILSHFGAIARDHQIETLKMVAAGRREEMDFSIDGFDEFDIEDLGSFLENAERATKIDIESETYQKEFQKKVARRNLDDAPPEIHEKIMKEIEAAKIVLPSAQKERELESKQKVLPGEGAPPKPAPSQE